ncbi:MAG: tyrosine-type recombinase/integrase [Synergistaceae bacterium]|nr:tyrosine-type recombinase/integrase [Synergistaceae bacterium]
MQKLTYSIVKKLQIKDKAYYICDGNGLNISVMPNGAKYWIVRYSANKKEHKTSLGKFPDISVEKARILAAEIKNRQKVGNFAKNACDNISPLFSHIINEWLEKRIKPVLSPDYVNKTIMRINSYILPALGNIGICEINSRTILDLCRKIESRGIIDTAHRVKQLIGQIFRYAIAAGYGSSDPTFALSNALQARRIRHHACITQNKGIAELMKKIYSYDGKEIVKAALKFSAFTFCRPGEIRKAEWGEIDYEKREWKIPADKMKMRRTHIVPLSNQTMQLLYNIKSISGNRKYIFPGSRAKDGNKPISENAISLALRKMGYSSDEMSAHGFRGMASTSLSEQGWSPEVIERQLAHAEKNASRAAYCHAELLPERRRMMQHWSDYLESMVRNPQ